MIVKNEGHIIRDTLTKLINKVKIDYWVISDTGSTDNTQQIITDFFNEKNIKGELYEDTWKDFGHNRSKALEHAFGKSNYVLIFDADDEICGNFILPELVKDSYEIQFGDTKCISELKTLIVNNKKRWKYVGVLYEYIMCTEQTNGSSSIKGDYYTVSGRNTHRNRDGNKYAKDAIVLEIAYADALMKKDDIYNRYGFYCANSYMDGGRYEEAIKWYKLTLENSNSSQEKYISCLRLYHCYNALKQKETGMFYLVKAFTYDNQRAECIYELVSYYCSSNMNHVAYTYYQLVKSFYENKFLIQDLEDKLFLDVKKANLLLPYYMIIVADRMNDRNTGILMYRIIFTKKHKDVNMFYVGNMLYNLQFFIEYCKNDNAFLTLFKEYVDFLLSIEYPVFNHEFMINYEQYGIVQPNKKNIMRVKKDCSKSNKILIFVGFSDRLWNDTLVSQISLGGSEKAVAYVSRYFPKEYEIYISGDVQDEKVGNITYINRHKLQNVLNTEQFHTIIVSRYISFFVLYNNFSCYQLFISSHDSPGFLNNYNNISVENIISDWNNAIDGIICLTNWHKENILKFHPCLSNKMNLINNGILIDNFPAKSPKIKNKFVWTSCSYRGLNILLNLWEDILKYMPDATLDISSYNRFPSNDDDNAMLEIINKHDSIVHHGKLNSKQLYELMSRAEYWLYTTEFCETSCITALEMLMSEVVCLYYPLAGLIETMGDYGIQVRKGNEIETILNLSEKQKINMRTRGKEYALSCSWENRAKIWANTLKLNTDNVCTDIQTITASNTKIAVHNGFFFHYEMFGYILNYAKNHNYHVDIYTPYECNIGWLDFYKEFFNETVSFIDYGQYNSSLSYKYVFVTTDDDLVFKKEWIKPNVICINHYYKIRTPNFHNYINTGNFKDSCLEYSIPCYPIFAPKEKTQNQIITLIGWIGELNLNYNIINRLTSSNSINLIIIGRDLKEVDVSKFNSNVRLTLLKMVNTTTMYQILKKSSYVLYNHNNLNHNNCFSTSGSLQLALSTLCKLIIASSINKQLNIRNVLEFDIDSCDEINIDTPIDFKSIQDERDMHVEKFDKYVSSI
jgi:glycosyltransferase involved in cell wall biosynthesis